MDSNSIKRKVCERVIGRRPKKDLPYLGEGYYAVTDGYAGVMDVQAIKRFDLVGKLADSACLVFLWTTNKFLRPSYDIIGRWSFENLPLTLVWNKGQGPQFPNSPSYYAEKEVRNVVQGGGERADVARGLGRAGSGRCFVVAQVQ